MAVANITWEVDSSKVTASMREAAGGAEQLAASTEKAKAKLDQIGNRAKESLGFLEKLGGSAASMIGLGAGFAVANKAAEFLVGAIRSIPDEIGRVVDKASRLSDLSAKLDISTSSLQKLEYVGKLSGVSLEAVSGAALKLQDQLVRNPELFAKWNLSAQRLKELRPEQQLVAISDAIRAIGDRQQQVAAIKDLLGKGGIETLGLMRQDLSALLVESDALGAAMGDDLVGKLDEVEDASTRLSVTWEALREKLVAGGVAASGADDFLNDLAKAVGVLNQNAEGGAGPLAIYIALLERLTGLNQLRDAVRILALLNEGGPGPKGATRSAIAGVFAGPADIDAEMARILRDAVKLTEDQVRATDKLAKANDRAAEAARRHATEAKHTLEIQKEFNRLIDQMESDIAKAWTNAPVRNFPLQVPGIGGGRTTHFDFDAIAAETAEKHRRAGQLIAGYFADTASQIGGTWGAMFHDMGLMLEGWTSKNKAGLGKWVSDNEEAIGKVMVAVQGLIAAYQGGRAAGSPGRGALSGAASGAAVGTAILPGWGTAIGAVVGGIAGFFGGKKGRAEQLAELRSEFDALMAQAEKAGILFDRLFDTSSAEGLRQAIADIKGELDLQNEAQQKANDVIEKYGITLDQLGPKAREQRLHEWAVELYGDFKILEALGVDLDVILEKMGDQLIEFFQTAIRTGTSVPEALRPILQHLIDEKLLLDENGRAYESVEETGITFAQELSVAIQGLIEKVELLVNTLLGIPNIERTITIEERRRNLADRPLFGGGSDGPPEPVDDDERPGGPRGGGRAMGAWNEFLPPRTGGHWRNLGEAGRGEYLTVTHQPIGGGGGFAMLAGRIDALSDRINASDARYEQSNRALILALPAMWRGERALAGASR